MQLTLSKYSALSVLRSLRADPKGARKLSRRSNALAPDPAPNKRWSKKLVHEFRSSLPCQIGTDTLEVAVPSSVSRLRTGSLSCTVYDKSVPENAFINLGGGLGISGPELLFTELASSMHPLEHLMLGHELCGSFSRDAQDPYNGAITYGVQPATSVQKIRLFLEQAKNIQGIAAARKTVAFLNDNAWSPTESLVAALLNLPIDSLGFELGPLILNPRFERAHDLPGARSSRVPDIMFADTSIGVNYDGLVHLDLDSIVKAAVNMGAHPGISQTEAAVNKAVADVRAKAIDDIRRNRELSADGLSVFPLVKEDLYAPGGLDHVVAFLLDALETHAKRDVSTQRKALKQTKLSHARYQMMMSFLPGRHERNVQIGRFVQGYAAYEGPAETHECWIEL